MWEYHEIQREVIKVVDKGKQEYQHKYEAIPRYVKVPYEIYRKLSITQLIYREVCQQFTPEMLMGLIVCPTYRIEKIDEIEVF